jgi:hypothetical protein
MYSNLLRLSKVQSLPLSKAMLYKWKHLKKHPQLFVKIDGALFVDLLELDRIIEAGRQR